MTERPEKVYEAFRDLRAKLKVVITDADPSDDNLHFGYLRKVEPKTFTELTNLAKEGLSRVEARAEFFLKRRLYDDGMFWYDLMLAISAAARGSSLPNQPPLRSQDFEPVVVALVRISLFSTVHGRLDIYKRNQEALGNLLWAAREEGLMAIARRQAAQTNEERVTAFVDETIMRVQKVLSASG